MKVVHVVPHVDEEAAGPSYSVPRLAQAQAEAGDDVVLACLAARAPIPGVTTRVFPQWALARRFAISPAHARAVAAAADEVDIVHNHSLWSMVNVAVGWTVPGRRARLVVSPRGTLAPWALQQSRLVKRLVWPLQRRALQRAHLLHATSEAEYEDIRRLGLGAPVAVIPNGIDLPAARPAAAPGARRTLLFLGRLHPTKGIDVLLSAWRELAPRFPDWDLRLVGKGEPAHEAALRQLARELGVLRVEFAGPRYGADKTLAFQQADVFVLPTRSENFGMAVAEALAHGLPAVVSQGAPWAGLAEQDCGWWIPLGVDTLVSALQDAMARPADELRAMGQRGRDWMARDYGWQRVAADMHRAYAWAVAGGACPSFVRLK